MFLKGFRHFFRSPKLVREKSKGESYYLAMQKKSSLVNSWKNEIQFGAESLNRVSFLRENGDFIKSSVSHPSTRFIFFENTNPLIIKKRSKELVKLTNGDDQLRGDSGVVKGLNNHEEWRKALDQWSNENLEHSSYIRTGEKPTLVFLGLEDQSVGLNIGQLKSEEDGASSEEKYLDYQGRYQGIPYYAVDVTHSPLLKEIVAEHMESNGSVTKDDCIFSHSRKHYLDFFPLDAALYSHGKMFIDWLDRNRFCGGCGSPVVPIHAGAKLKCTNDSTEELTKALKCPVRNARVSNFSFPRTDCVVITAIANRDHSKILLSLNKRYASANFYSCTAGFMEPAETVEVATKRELWEETGIITSGIRMVMTQPWPFPANLMIGCLAIVDFNGVNEVIDLGHDREIADARWFDASFVRTLLETGGDADLNPEGIVVPPAGSIAHHLIKLACNPSENVTVPNL